MKLDSSAAETHVKIQSGMIIVISNLASSETSRDLVVRRLPAKWIEALLLNVYIFTPIDT